VNDDDDLVAISLSVDTPKCNDKVRLVIEQPAIIKVWSSALKQNEITNGTTWNACGYNHYPETLWVEGRIPGNAKLWFEYLGGPAERIVPPTPEIQFTVLPPECFNDDDRPVDEYYRCGCEDYECEDCWEYTTVPANDASPCPECSDAMGGCYSTHERIPEEYAVYVPNILDPPEPGQWGVCGYHVKAESVRFLTTCVEYQTDVSAVIDVVASLGLDLSTWLDCAECVATRSPVPCYKCIIGLIAGEIYDGLPCIWVDECDRCNYSDEACSYPLTTPNVIDWNAVDLCYGL